MSATDPGDDTPAPPARHPLALQPFSPELKDAANGWLFTLDPPEVIRGRLEVLASYGPILRAGGITFGEEEGGYIYPTTFTYAFMKHLYETGWVDIDGAWGDALDRRALYMGTGAVDEPEPDGFREATPFHLHRRLTAILRIGRKTDGVIERAFESGLMLQIVERAEALRDSMN